ncbi:MAG: hypothetical protein JNM00_06880 [Flavobacteriales bacterium]|nr:hypothetical protein [Flavobacteriales bacterium]
MDTNEILKQVYRPIQAVIVYMGGNRDYYLESHEIDQSGKLLAGQPLKRETLTDLAEYIDTKKKQQAKITGLIPGNLLFCEYNVERKVLAWYEPPQVRHMHFNRSLHIKSGPAFQPGLIFIVENKELSVFAYVENGAPTAKSQLYHAPYHNTDSEGLVCQGNVQKPKQPKTYQDHISYWDVIFWASEFSHLANNKSPINGNLNTYWKKAIARGNKHRFDTSVLLPITEGKSMITLAKKLEELS